MLDDNPRPQKRVRRESFSLSPPSSSPLTPPPSSPVPSTSTSQSDSPLRPLPHAVLLLSLPSLLVHPPSHRYYIQSICLSLCSLRKCLSLPALSPEIECRAWTGLAELGMKVISSGFSQSEDHLWARGIEAEVNTAISKGAIIAQKHPSLRVFSHHIALLQVQFSHWQRKTKFARTQIRNLIVSFRPTDPPYIVYSAHLAAITLFTTPKPRSTPSTLHTGLKPPLSPAYNQSPQDIHAALSAIQTLESLSRTQGHTRVTLLSHVLRLRVLVAANMWNEVGNAILLAESALGLSYEAITTPRPRMATTKEKDKAEHPSTETTFISFEDALESAMVVHTLIMTVVYFTHIGSAAEASPRLSHLHALLDSGALDQFAEGIIEISLPDGPPLSIQVTHPRILFLLAFLVSSVAKRDAVGRKPKRKVFASEGLTSWEKEMDFELLLPSWANFGDVEEVEQRLARIKADLLCELAAVSIMRSEFDAAEEHLAALIAHTRTYSIFELFAARITLHNAHLAHALDHGARALECYRIAVRLAGADNFVALSARAGEIILLMGMQAEGLIPNEPPVNKKEVTSVAKACRGMGGTLEAVGHVLDALVSPEILKAKQHLKASLELASRSQDNHLRAVVLALISAHYFHTAGDHALSMLQTCSQLAAGLGAPPTKDAPGILPIVGNARLSLWVGQKFLELYRRAGKDARAEKQAAANQRLEETVKVLAVRDINVSRPIPL